LQRARLAEAQLTDAKLIGTRLQGANLFGAQLQGASLCAAEFDLGTEIIEVALRGASIRSVDFTNVPEITEYLCDAFGDESVTLVGGQGPEAVSWPSHWPTFKLKLHWEDAGQSVDSFEQEWRKWQADPDNYTPPKAPEEG